MKWLRIAAITAILFIVASAIYFYTIRPDELSVAPSGATTQGWKPFAPVRQSTGQQNDKSLNDTPANSDVGKSASGHFEIRVFAENQPQAGATVALYMSADEGGPEWIAGSAGVTDQLGNVRLAAAPGPYLLAVHSDGWPAYRRNVVRRQGESTTREEVHLVGGSTISGFVKAKKQGEPIPMAEVNLIPVVENSSNTAPPDERITTQTDSRGAFHFDAIATGTYSLIAEAPGHQRSSLRRLIVPSTQPIELLLGGASYIEGVVRGRDNQPVDQASVSAVGVRGLWTATTGPSGTFSLEVEPGMLLISARKDSLVTAALKPVVVGVESTVQGIVLALGLGAKLEGRVRDQQTHAPIADAQLVLRSTGLSHDLERTTTDVAGRFSFHQLPAGGYDLTCLVPSHRKRSIGGITVSEGQTFTLDVAMSRGGSIKGRVVGNNMQGLHGALIEAGPNYQSPTAFTRTNAAGEFVIEGQSPGQTLIKARQNSAAAVRVVAVADGKTTEIGDLVLGVEGRINGFVRHKSDSKAVAGATVTAVRSGQNAEKVGAVTTGPDGSFSLALVPDKYVLSAYFPEPHASGQSTTIEVSAGQSTSTEISLETKEIRLRGSVLEAEGAPSPKAIVRFTIPGQPASSLVTADNDGRFAIAYPTWNPGSMTLVAQNGGRTAQREVDASAGDVTLTLQPAATISVRVRLSGEVPSNGFIVRTMVQSERRMATVRPTERRFPQPSFEIVDCEPGPTEVAVRTEDGRTGSTTLSVRSGETNTVEVQLTGEASIAGRFVDSATKKPIADVGATLGGPWARSDADGRWQIQNVVPGARTLRVVGKGYAGLLRELTLSPGQTLDVGELALAPTSAEAP